MGIKGLGWQLAGFVLLAAAVPTLGQTATWVGGHGDDWHTWENWDPVGDPEPWYELVVPSGSPQAGSVEVTGGGSITVSGFLTEPWLNGVRIATSMGTGELSIVNGGAILSGWAVVGEQSSGQGTALVTGDGSWEISDVLELGRHGEGSLWVSGSGNVHSQRAALGVEGGSSGLAVVNGYDSQWTQDNELAVGQRGAGSLSVLSGGLAQSGTSVLGSEATGTGSVLVMGQGARWKSETVTIGKGGTGSVSVLSGGEMQTGGDYGWGHGVLGEMSASSGYVLVQGAGAAWRHRGWLKVGDSGRATVDVLGGAAVSVDEGCYLAFMEGSTAAVTVAGLGSHWEQEGELWIGKLGTGTLSVLQGGRLSSRGTVAVGALAGSVGEATVAGSGSRWEHTGDLKTGYFGRGTLRVLSAAEVSCFEGGIATEPGSSGSVEVDGNGSRWTCYGDLTVGDAQGGEGDLTIRNEGQVTCGSLLVGFGDGSAGVVGPGSRLTVEREVRVGGRGGLGIVEVHDGGRVSGGSGFVGDAGGPGGMVTIAGAGTAWQLAGEFVVGNGGRGTLDVENGAYVSCQTGYVGRDMGSVGEVVVDGPASWWECRSDLFLGQGDGNGLLAIRNGGRVSSGSAHIGDTSRGVGEVTVEGPNSAWSVAGELQIGGKKGSLTIRDGGAVSCGGVGASGQGEASEIIVSGPGSAWTVTWGLFIGHASVTVADGASVAVGGALDLPNSPGMGELAFTGGRLSVGELRGLEHGTFHWTGGTLEVTGEEGLSLSFPSQPEQGFVLSSGLTLRAKKVRIGESAVMVLDGGEFDVPDVENSGMLILDRPGPTPIDANVTNSWGTILLKAGQSHVMTGLLENNGQVRLEEGARLLGATGSADEAKAGPSPSSPSGDVLINRGSISGDGEIVKPLDHDGGTISVAQGEHLVIHHLVDDLRGEVDLKGGTLEFLQPIVNEWGITGHGTLIVHGQLSNQGGMHFQSGRSEVICDVRNVGSGRVTMDPGANVIFRGSVSTDLPMQVLGTVVFAGDYEGPSIEGGGGLVRFEAGASFGRACKESMLFSDVEFGPEACLEVQIGGPGDGGKYDALVVQGTVHLDGALKLVWDAAPNELILPFGGQYDVLRCELALDGNVGVTGKLAAYVAAVDCHAEAEGGWRAVRVELYDLLTGDADLNGTVNDADLAALERGFGLDEPFWRDGDFDLNGVTDFRDYLLWKENQGRSVPGAAVPEPATLALLALGAAALVRRRDGLTARS